MKKYIVTIIILFLIIFISICGTIVYTNVKANEGGSLETLEEKAISEIDFLGTEIVEIMNELNNIYDTNYKLTQEDVTIKAQDSENSTSGENVISESIIQENGVSDGEADEINWKAIGETAKTVYSSWTTILIDLTTIEVNKEDLLKFNDLLDQEIEAINAENKEEALNYAADLYNLLTSYLDDFSDDEKIKNIYKTKSNILYAYALVNSDNWDEASSYMIEAINVFDNIMNDQVNNINNIEEINKAYILINELSDDVSKNNKETFYINYQDLISELDNI